MTSKDKLNDAENSYLELIKSENFHQFKTYFHSCCESLSSIYKVGDKKLKDKIGLDFFPNIVKKIREDNFHLPGIDSLSTGTSSIPGIISMNGPIRISNRGTFNINGIELPQGDIEFGSKSAKGFENTLNGKENEVLNEIPTSIEFKMRDLIDTKLKKDLKKYNIPTKTIRQWTHKISNYKPIEFIADAIEYYKNEVK